MKVKNTILLLLILSIVAGSTFLALNGIKVGKYEVVKAKDAIDLGLDLAGGVYVVLEAQTDAKGAELQKIMEQTKTIINERVNALGVSEPNIAIEGNNRIRVELAGIDDPQKAIELIGKTAQLQFVDPDKNIVLTGKNVVGSEVQYHNTELGQQEIVVGLELDKEGTKNFAEATGRLTLEKNREDRIIYIILDDQIISYPAVQSAEEGGTAITDGKAVISGGFTLEEASELSALIRAGALPVEMKELQTSIIGPTLGLEAYEKSVKAVGIALLIIMIFMIVMYRLPGFVASIGLIVYTLITVLAMSSLGVKLTLPGIAGLILSIGMAVDANVIIFERIKEEIRMGKSIRTAVDAGFKRALTSVMDSNITTLIAGVVLYYFGIGPIKGFGVTLIIGIVASMITAVIISKYLLKLIVSLTGGKNPKLYGVNREVER
ncbi:protein translocase subunit SecD [Tissierella sp. MB52-C2]|uniref:protein translocase subunit SecD n=1 Tax=Tissierella sp. MB52-C2 TaxID=3070999 RepID=UPI00280B06A3|nr:protein translocase subunit SecD [Tissierella sp. MB52-C2]WMM26833.1 protein translocase subunit SecD [Tissierella sp. MB52-C2]